MASTDKPWQVFGHIPGIPVGKTWKSREECSKDHCHAPTMAGISGSKNEGCWSVVLSAFYEDDEDFGDYFFYTGSGGREGRPQSGAQQTKDMSMSHPPNKSLQLNVSTGNPVRVIRSSAGKSKYRPAAGYRYDGLYKVVRAWTEEGRLGFQVCKFEMQRLPGQPPVPLYRDSIMEIHKRPPNYRQSQSVSTTYSAPLPPNTTRVQSEPGQSAPGPGSLSRRHSEGHSDEERPQSLQAQSRMHPRSGYHNSHGIIVAKDYRVFSAAPPQSQKDASAMKDKDDTLNDKGKMLAREDTEGIIKRPKLSLQPMDKEAFLRHGLKRKDAPNDATNTTSHSGWSKSSLPSWLPISEPDPVSATPAMSRGSMSASGNSTAPSHSALISPTQHNPHPLSTSTALPIPRGSMSAQSNNEGGPSASSPTSPAVPVSRAGTSIPGSSTGPPRSTSAAQSGPPQSVPQSDHLPKPPRPATSSLPPRPNTTFDFTTMSREITSAAGASMAPSHPHPTSEATVQPEPPQRALTSALHPLPPRPVATPHKWPLPRRTKASTGHNANQYHPNAALAPQPMSRTGQSAPGTSRPSLHLTPVQMSRGNAGVSSNPGLSPKDLEEAAQRTSEILSQLSFKKRRIE
ncbi:hypothetical protein K474DRAFT_1777143 [Panus rudis PR-1116 ss-1]|nr:hypothetical protein K474DRAFT_1777143 [Panus rudis PR-1116 ss-1]